MPISKTYLPDINVWVAMVFDGHDHHPAAVRWFDDLQENVAFCRITQMGLLRLMVNRKVMGHSALSHEKAWGTYDQLHEDPRITFLNESSGLEELWRTLTQGQKLPHSWTDTYLLAFAKARDLTFVTFDRALRLTDPTAVILS